MTYPLLVAVKPRLKIRNISHRNQFERETFVEIMRDDRIVWFFQNHVSLEYIEFRVMDDCGHTYNTVRRWCELERWPVKRSTEWWKVSLWQNIYINFNHLICHFFYTHQRAMDFSILFQLNYRKFVHLTSRYLENVNSE